MNKIQNRFQNKRCEGSVALLSLRKWEPLWGPW